MTPSNVIWSGAQRTWSIPLWGARWGREALLARRGQIGSRAFGRGFRQETLDDESRTFPSVVKCAVEDLDPVGYMSRHWPCFTGVDLSTDKRPGCAFVTIAERPADRKRLVVDVRAKSLTSPQVWQELEDIERMFAPQVFMVETNALQGAVLEWGRTRNATLPVQGFVTGANKANPVIGLPGLEVEFENQGWMIPRPSHPLDCECAWCRLWSELTGHPIGVSTDLVMALWFAREGARGAGRQLRGGYLSALGEEYRG